VFRAVAFDLDGTLAVTDEDRGTLLAAAVERAGIERPVDREAYLEAHGEHSGTGSRRPVFEALVGEDAEALTRAYREAVGGALSAVDGAETVLAALRGRYRVGLLTDGPERAQLDKLERLGWTDAFDAVVVTGSVGAPKPDRRAFGAIGSELGVEPGETVYVGDDPDRDVAGAAAAGLTAVQVRYPGGPEPHPEAAATVERGDLGQLPALLARLDDALDDA